MKWKQCTPECFDNEDWMQYHYRYRFSDVKLDTDLFEVRDGALMKIGGNGRLEFSSIEYLDEEDVSYSGEQVADMMKASFKAGKKTIDLQQLQQVLHDVQQVMAGYSQDDTWSDYDREAHKKLIELQYKVAEEIERL